MTRKEINAIFKPELGKTVTRWEALREDEEGTFGRFEIVYHGRYEEPDIWLLTWEHYRSFLRDNLPLLLVHAFHWTANVDIEKLNAEIVKLLDETED